MANENSRAGADWLKLSLQSGGRVFTLPDSLESRPFAGLVGKNGG
jgi:hypothetical protein